MVGIKIEKFDNNLVIKWQLTNIEIPLSDIKNVKLGDTYAGEGHNAIRIGTPFATTDRIIIETDQNTYILYTTNVSTLKNKIISYLNTSE